jgi:hypothetical protein
MFARTMIDWAELAMPLETASAAIGRLDARLGGRTILRDAWLYRTRLREAVRCAAADGRKVDLDELLCVLTGIPLRRRRDWGGLSYALGVFEALSVHTHPDRRKAAVERMREGVDGGIGGARSAEFLQDLDLLSGRMKEAGRGLPALVAVATELMQWLQDGGDRLTGRLAAIRHLAAAGLTSIPLPCLTGTDAMRDDRDPRRWNVNFMKAIARDAQQGERILIELWHAWVDWHRRIGPRRRNSKLPRLIDLAAAHPLTTPAHAAKLLRCSVRGASMLLDELVEAGVLIEATGRKSWRGFVTRDFIGVAAVARDGLRRAPSEAPGGLVEKGARMGRSGPEAPGQRGPAPADRLIMSRTEDLERSREQDWDSDLGALLSETDAAIKHAQVVISSHLRDVASGDRDKV